MKLSQVNFVGLFAKENIANNLAAVLEDQSAVLARKPASHPLLQLRHVHAVAVPLILNQSVIKFRQQWAVVQSCRSKSHAAYDTTRCAGDKNPNLDTAGIFRYKSGKYLMYSGMRFPGN